MQEEERMFHELSFYTLSHPSPDFIHQHIVDAFGAQTADKDTKPIRVIFSLAGLYLHLEEGFTGKEVQNFHQKMALGKQAWPEISFPKNRGKITVAEVLNAEAGAERDQMIRLWCEEVWEAFQENRFTILRLIQGYKT